MIKKQGFPWYAPQGAEKIECYITDDAQPLSRPGYFNYEVVYISEEVLPQLNEWTMSAFGVPFVKESLADLYELVPDDLRLESILWEGKMLYPDVSGWIID